jgi:ATP-dependent DNA helicase HFM1/MER3
MQSRNLRDTPSDVDMNDDSRFVRVADVVPEKFRSIFNFTHFNAVQSIIVHQILNTRVNMVIAAPTGSGKTVVHELAILRLLIEADGKDIKCVFVAPNKALCQQRCAEWQRSFGALGLL